MIANRLQEVNGYYWRISNDYHYVNTLPELVIELGRKEAANFKVTAYQATSFGDDLPESISEIYSTVKPSQIFAVDGFAQRYFNSMKSLYLYILGLTISAREVEISYNLRPSISGYTFLIKIIDYIVECDVDWMKEGF